MIGIMVGLALASTAARAPAAECKGTSVAIEDCQRRQLQDANARLDAVYHARMVDLSPARRARLRDEERQWIAARDARCRVGPDQGTSGPLAAASCLLEETNARTILLSDGR